MVAATGTSTLGLIVWTFSIAIAGWTAKRLANWITVRKVEPKAEAIRHTFQGGFREAICEAGAIAFVAILAWACFLPRAIYNDHESLSSTNSALSARLKDLSEVAKTEDARKHALAEAQAKADNWQQAYLGVSKGEWIPDRILNSEETDKLHDQLLRLARDSKSKEFSRVEVTSAFLEDRESSRLAGQLLKVFQDSGWAAHWPTSQSKEMKDFFLTSYPTHVLIYTDGSAHNAEWIRLALNDVGVDATVPEQMPPGIKGTMICVGDKQFP
jgi:hypothetical protein